MTCNSPLVGFGYITFTNTPLKHRGFQLNISNCVFNKGSNVETVVGVSEVDNCTFRETTFKSNDAIMTGEWQHTTVSNCHFTGRPYRDMALQINGSRILEIFNNTITGYATGINLTSSGATTAYYYGCKTVSAIHDNEILNCTTGIELYNSIVNIVSNNIHDNSFGVKLFNNSSTSFGRLELPNRRSGRYVLLCVVCKRRTDRC